MALQDYRGEQLLEVLVSCQHQGIVHHIGVVYPRRSNALQVFIPKGHALAIGSLVTLHLDNCSGEDELDAERRVYRASYNGRVVQTDENWATVEPVEYMLIHGTLAAGQPHTTVLAFLSSEDDGVFLISMPGTFKSQVLKCDPRCFFTIDERAKFTFEQSIEWNDTTLATRAHLVPQNSPVHGQIRTAFLLKNPWEAAFFMRTELEMLHLQRVAVVCAGEPRHRLGGTPC